MFVRRRALVGTLVLASYALPVPAGAIPLHSAGFAVLAIAVAVVLVRSAIRSCRI